MRYTPEALLIGAIQFECSIGQSDDSGIHTVERKMFDTARDAEAWGIAEVRRLNASKDGYSYDGWVRRVLWVDDSWHDDEYGTIQDGVARYDNNYNSYTSGITWYDDHPNGVEPEWDTQ